MEFIQSNLGNILVGVIVFAALAFVLFRTITNIRSGKSGCGCGCEGCAKAAKKA